MFAVLVGSLLPNVLLGQATKLDHGMEEFRAGDYEKALEYFSEAINTDRQMTPAMFCEAYYYRGLTYVRLHNEAFSGEDQSMQKRYYDALLSAYKDYKSSLGYDDGTFWQKIDMELKTLHHALLEEGLTSLNLYNDQVFNGKADAKILQRAQDYLEAAFEIRENYLVCDLLGQVYLDLGKKGEAANYFRKAMNQYSDKLPDEPDFLMAYVYYRLAAIYKTDSINTAMQYCNQGQALMASEYARYLGMKDKLKPGRAKQMQDQYELAVKDLENLKLDLYLNDRDSIVQALHVFEQKLEQSPDNVDFLIGYASLLEKSDKGKAIATYKNALALDPHNTIALFNAGALYYSKGKELFDAAQDTKDNKQYDLLTEEGKKEFASARGYFERALQEEPTSQETIQALKTIAIALDDPDGYQKYKDMENKAGN